MKNVKDELEKIWKKPYMDNIPKIRDRSFMFCQNESQKDILITGMNPSYRDGGEQCKKHPVSPKNDFCFECAIKGKYDPYFSPIKKMLLSDGAKEAKLDFRDRCAYLDIFYFRATEQKILEQEILKNDLAFISDQLAITQDTIENVIKPKLIIIKNKESAAYFGILAEKYIWMGYDFEPIKNIMNGVPNVGDLYRIKGLSSSPKRINREAFQTTNLNGTLVLVTPQINQYLKKEKRPTPEQIEKLLKKNYSIVFNTLEFI